MDVGYVFRSGNLFSAAGRHVEMSGMQRDGVRDAQRVVKQVQEIVRHQFNPGRF